MLSALVVELVYKSAALAATIWAFNYLTSIYAEALVEFTRTYITIVDLLYSEERLPLRI
jgi:hypothetical protein